MNFNENQFENLVFQGEEKEVELLSSQTVIIREPNFADQGILSRRGDAMDGSNILNYLSNLIVKDWAGKKVTTETIMDWKVSDIYYLLFKQRTLFDGSDLEFEFACSNPKCGLRDKPQKMTQDLKDFEMGAGFIYSAIPYPKKNEPQVTLQLRSGKKIRYSILTFRNYKKSLERNSSEEDNIAIITDRDAEWESPRGWEKIVNAAMFSAKEGSQMLASINKNDPFFDPFVKTECSACGQVSAQRVFSIPDFYYPEGAN